MKTVLVLAGSLRRESFNLRFAKALAKLAEGRLKFEFADLGSLPLYNEDLWETPPASVTALKSAIEKADGVLFVTPEYNRSFSPVIANAIDWANRPWGKNSWAGKPGFITGVTPGSTGTAAAQVALRGIVAYVGVNLMFQPEVYWTFREEHFDGDSFKDEGVKKFLSGWVDAFEKFIG